MSRWMQWITGALVPIFIVGSYVASWMSNVACDRFAEKHAQPDLSLDDCFTGEVVLLNLLSIFLSVTWVVPLAVCIGLFFWRRSRSPDDNSLTMRM
ncbi:MAG: hypothetical protein KF855_17715 [Acidobacteria bacterium]|nr:hypothetical protein [Acidobacteriota bacterium]